MKVCTCILLHGIFAYTNSQIRPRGDHKFVNLRQETAREYSDEVYSGGTNNLDEVHNFITRGTTLSSRNMKFVFREPRVETLTDFIQETVKVLNTYEDTVFKDIFHVLDNEIRKCHYRGCKFSELTQNSYTRSLLARLFKLIREKPVSFTKANINEVVDMMRDETYDNNIKQLLDYINSLYRNTEISFHSILNELEYYGNTKSVRTHNNLVKVIRNGVRTVLFNPYDELNTKTRRELKERIEIFWKQFKNNPAARAEMNDISNTDPVIKSVIHNSFMVTENMINEVKNPEPYSKYEIQLQNKGEIIVGLETNDEQFRRDKTENDESSNKSREQITNFNKDEISSAVSFDSSSNSIKNSQGRHKKYHTQRYKTLNEISYKANTTKKTKIIPISANVRTKRRKVRKRRTTTSTPRERDVSSDSTEKTDDTKLNISNSSHDAKSGLTLEADSDMKCNTTLYSKSAKKTKIIPISGNVRTKRPKVKKRRTTTSTPRERDVSSDSTEKIKMLRGNHDTDDTKLNISNSSHDTKSGLTLEADSDMKYDTTLYSKSAKQTKTVRTKSTIRPRSMRAQAEIRPQKPTAHIKNPSRYSKRHRTFDKKQLSDFRKNIAPPLPNEGHLFNQFMKDENQNQKYLLYF